MIESVERKVVVKGRRMEVDELEGGFLQQFSNMQTIDRLELIVRNV